MFDVGFPEFFVLGLVALLVFGPERLPEVALQAARLIRQLRGMAQSARSELTDNLEPHMRELSELRELDPRKMAKRFILDPVDEDGTLRSLRGKGLLSPADSGSKVKNQAKAGAAAAKAVAGGLAAASAGDASGVAPAEGLEAGPVAGSSALPPAMAPAVTPVGERPPYDVDAT